MAADLVCGVTIVKSEAANSIRALASVLAAPDLGMITTFEQTLGDIVDGITEMNVGFSISYIEKQNNMGAKVSATTSKDLLGIVETQFPSSGPAARVRVNPASFVPAIARTPNYVDMDINTTIFQAPIEELIIPPVQDAYVRQAKPLVPYGLTDGLAVGHMTEGELRSYLDFDITSIRSALVGMNIKSIELVIDKVDAINATVSIHDTLSVWHENTVLWATNVQYSPTPLSTVTVTNHDSFLKADFTDLILARLNQNINFFNISLIGVSGVLQMFSKESTSSPKILVKYQNPKWSGSLGRIERLAMVTIRRLAENDMQSVVRLTQKLEKAAKAFVRFPYLRESTVKINKPNIPATVTPVHSNYIQSRVSAAHRYTSEVPGAAKNPNRQLRSTVTVVPNSNLPAVAVVKDMEISNIPSHVQINKPFLIAFLEVVRSTYLPSVVTAAINMDTDLPAMAKIISDKLYSKATVVRSKYVPSIVNIRQLTYNNLRSGVRVSKDNIQAKVKNQFNTYVGSRVFVHANVYDSTQATVYISRRNLMAYVRTVKSSYLGASVFVKERNDLHSTVQVEPSSSELASTVEVHPASFKEAIVAVQRDGYADLASVVSPRVKGSSEQLANVSVKEVSNIPAAVAAKQVSNLQVRLIVRQIDVSYLHARVGQSKISASNDLGARVTKRVRRRYLEAKAKKASYFQPLPVQTDMAPKPWTQ